ncbi:RusA family crossover junction endodeoxyribonuclease [Streptosporangium sp. NPDC020072]|uniref:RusA family crossover junction endodeoxyribonuclease n=1 Tax=Streptosporangium sp. NPDC020072 TaxID=3154788 RepID=UPI00343D7DA1
MPWDEPLLEVVAYGTPAPQGSKRHVGKGRMVESSKKVGPWRETVKYAALEVLPEGWVPLDQPVAVQMVFTLARPISAPRRRVYPDRTPDLSKLVRSTEDALTDAGVWVDDARAVEFLVRKLYTGSPHPDVQRTAGVVVRIWSLGGDVR